jgi:branched-chain amino acid transport system ATP-binding protein
VATLEIVGVQKKFGGVVALAGIDISIDTQRITGVIGPNGSGKTTLFNVVAGAFAPTAGRVLWQGADITGKPAYEIARRGLVRTFQQSMSYPGLSVRDNVRIGCEHGRAERFRSTSRWQSAEEILDFVGLGGRGGETAGSLSFGNLRRLGLAVALGADPLLLLLDEPAAGLSDSEGAALTELILQFPPLGLGVCVIDHDMALMGAVCDRLVVLNFGTKIAEGTPEEVLNDATVLDVYLGTGA